MSHLAVITTPTQPYHLVKEINGKYFEIESINKSMVSTLKLKV